MALREQAEQLVQQFEARGHRQRYWVEEKMDVAYYTRKIMEIGSEPDEDDRSGYASHYAFEELFASLTRDEYPTFVTAIAQVLRGGPDVPLMAQAEIMDFVRYQGMTDKEILDAVIDLHQRLPMQLEYEDTDPPPDNWLEIVLQSSIYMYVHDKAPFMKRELLIK
jgi:hypothetical protein